MERRKYRRRIDEREHSRKPLLIALILAMLIIIIVAALKLQPPLAMHKSTANVGGGDGYYRLRAGQHKRAGIGGPDAELEAAGCVKVYRERASGAKTDRLDLAKLLGRLEEGDVLIVTRLDRLARSTRDLLNVLDAVAKQGAGFQSLKDTWADTTTPHGRLMLTVLGGRAEFERELIRARTGEGRKRAQERGVRFGRPRKLTAHQRQEALRRIADGETRADVARTYAVDPTTIGRLVPLAA